MKNSTVAAISIIILVLASVLSTLDFGKKNTAPIVSESPTTVTDNTNPGNNKFSFSNTSITYFVIIIIAVFIGVTTIILARSKGVKEDGRTLPQRFPEAHSRSHAEEYKIEIALLQEEYYKKAIELRERFGAKADLHGLRIEYQQKVFDVHNKHSKRIAQ